MSHKHTCSRCRETYSCDADLERNYDGWPDPVCELLVHGGDLQCEDCFEGRLPCDHCDGKRRGAWIESMQIVLCDDCLTNQGELQSERRLQP